MSTEISNYGELKNAVRDWLNRTDQKTLDKIPYFINFAEKQFTRLIRLPYYETAVQFNVEFDRDWIDLPPDFLAVKHLVVNDRICTRVDNETFLRLGSNNTPTMNNKTYFFTRVGSQIKFYPTITSGDFIQMIYHRDIPEMKEDDDAPYPLVIAPEVLLYQALTHASMWLRDNDQVQFWSSKAQEAVSGLQQQLDEAEWAGSTLQVRQFEEDTPHGWV